MFAYANMLYNMDGHQSTPMYCPYGIPSAMTFGLPATHINSKPLHPLQRSELNYAADQDRLRMNMLRSVQGLHAPLRLQMERKAASMAGGRLPFLHSEKLALSVLNGTDTTLDLNDVFNTPDTWERMGMPSAEMERASGQL